MFRAVQAKADSFLFEDTELSLSPGCYVCFTEFLRVGPNVPTCFKKWDHSVFMGQIRGLSTLLKMKTKMVSTIKTEILKIIIKEKIK